MLAPHMLNQRGWILYNLGDDCCSRSRLLTTKGALQGGVLKVKREQAGLVAFFIVRVGIFPCQGARDPDLNERLREAFKRGDWKSVQSLRRDIHDPTDTCCLHSESFCLSRLAVT